MTALPLPVSVRIRGDQMAKKQNPFADRCQLPAQVGAALFERGDRFLGHGRTPPVNSRSTEVVGRSRPALHPDGGPLTNLTCTPPPPLP